MPHQESFAQNEKSRSRQSNGRLAIVQLRTEVEMFLRLHCMRNERRPMDIDAVMFRGSGRVIEIAVRA